MDLRKTLIITNGFVHDFAAGIWLAAMGTIVMLHHEHGNYPLVADLLNRFEHRFFWVSVVAAVVIMLTGAGRTFTYVDNWYGEDAEVQRRRALMVKHLFLFGVWGAGYLYVWPMVFHRG
ncbi:MAG: hypothetical protein Fur0034_21350 [Desulfuromonadia bacterium]